ncbi:hypothetical protein KUTeg_014860 [Tegillarca granosa]|uniref:Uncharacterized protein n=1 Tax=Tegillarca granosa TaxID=220873 RepID=A0ABQ9ER12_TEGGR|nr:hypothetical protein KUTeg_014860 [Tegillarca granosa]
MSESGEKFDESAIYNSTLPGDNERVNHLAAYARTTTVPNVFRDANEGRNYQTTAHFQFGSDANTAHSIYGKDFALAAMAKRGPPQKIITPAAGQLFQNDPEFSTLTATSSQVDYASKPIPNPKNAQGKTLMDINMGLHKTDHIIMTCDQNRHWDDRQKSLAHSDYIKHSAYVPAEQIGDSDVKYDFLNQHDILQHEPPENNTSEAKNNYIGTFMTGPNAKDRQKQKNKECKVRFNDNRSTHFIVGYSPQDFASETMVKFRGEGKSDKDVPPAGKTERTQPGKPKHINLSENTQDMFAADPYSVNKS